MDGALLIDFSNANRYFDHLLGQFGIKRSIVDSKDIKTQKRLLLPCDSYYFPYSKQNYLKYHLEHFILIHEYRDGIYEVSDDNPLFNGELSQKVVNESYDYFRHKIYQYGPIMKKDISTFSCIDCKPALITVAEFFEKVISGEIPDDKALLLIESTRVPLKRYNAIQHVAYGMNSKEIIIRDLIKTAKQYNDELSFISNLAGIGWRSPERYIKRIKSRLNRLKEFEDELNSVIIKRGEDGICGDMNLFND